MTDVAAPIHGRRLDARYTLLEKLGAGGQGEVWRAHDETRGMDIALKVLTPAVARADGMWAAFEHEYAIASRLDHSSVLKVFPPQRSGEVVVLPMELATGGDLRRLRGAGYLEIIPVLLDIAQALEHAHERGVIHRDLKPGNVLFDARGRVRLADFGAAGTTSTSAADARMQGLSPFTASPEQLRGEPPTCGDDIYGLGALAYELLSGYPPYYPHFDIKRAQHEPVPNLVPTRQIPPLLSALVMRMLEKSPRERPRSMREVIDELDAALNDTLTFDFETVEDPAHLESNPGETNRDEDAAPVFPPPIQPRTEAVQAAMLAGKTVALSAAYTSAPEDKVSAASARASGSAIARASGASIAAVAGTGRAERTDAFSSAGDMEDDVDDEDGSAAETEMFFEQPAATAGRGAGTAASARAAAPAMRTADSATQVRDSGRQPASALTQSAPTSTRQRAMAPVDPAPAPREWPSAQIRAAAATVAESREAKAKALIERVERAGEQLQQSAKEGRLSPQAQTPTPPFAPAPIHPAVQSEASVRRQAHVANEPQAAMPSRGPNEPPAMTPSRALIQPQPSTPSTPSRPANQPQEWSPTRMPDEPQMRSPSPAAHQPHASTGSRALNHPQAWSLSRAPDEPEAWAHSDGTHQPPASRGAQRWAPAPAQALRSAESPEWSRSGGPMRPQELGDPQAWQSEGSTQPLRTDPAQTWPASLQRAPFATAGFAVGPGAASISNDRPLWEDLRLEAVPRMTRLEPIKKRHWPMVLLGVLAGAAVAVFYLLPRYAPQTLPIDFAAISRATKNLAPSLPSAPNDTAAATDASAASEAKLQATRENFEHRLAALEARGAGVWGGPEFAMAKMRAAEAIGAHDAGNTRMAEERLADASHLLDQVDSRAPQALAAQLAAGQKALASGQQEVANQAFDLARRIDPNDRRIADGQRHTRTLPGVLPLIADGQNAETGHNYSRAAQDYSQALSLDPGNDKARAGLARANAAFGEDNYAKSVGSGFAALGAGRLDDAHDAFERARALRPNGSEAAEGLRRVGAALSAKGYASLRQRAAGLEAQERWDEAVQAYNSALQADPSLLFAQEGKNRAAARADLGASMQALIDRPERLASQSVRDQARALLQTANEQSPSGPVLRSQIARLGLLMPQDFDKPVRLSLVSDNATAVAIPSIGQFGTFGKRDIELKPGRYTVIGTRSGFREVRRDITIAPGQENQTISVSCSDPI